MVSIRLITLLARASPPSPPRAATSETSLNTPIPWQKSITASRWKGINYIRKYTIPGNPNTPLQENQRNLFNEAVESWKLLEPEQKEFYDKMAVGMSGYNLYIREYIEAYKNGGGIEPPVLKTLTVLNGTGQTLLDASVVITRGSKTVFRGLTDSQGMVRFALSRKLGPYDIRVSGDGYTAFTAQNLCPADMPSTATITPVPLDTAKGSVC